MRSNARKKAADITRPLLTSCAVTLSPDGLPQMRLEYVTGDADPLLGPHHALLLTIDPILATRLGNDLVRLATDARDALAARAASMGRQARH